MTDLLTPAGVDFVTEYHLATLSTLRDGRPHVVPVGFTFDGTTVRIITSGPSQKVLNARRAPSVSVCQVDGRRWLTLAGEARILDDPASVADAVARYESRYRPARENPLRVVIAFEVTSLMGSPSLIA